MTSHLSQPHPATDRADHPGRWWTMQAEGRMLCQLCPRACQLKPGDRGFCFVRIRRGDAMVLDTYGRSTGFCIDPIEKKPLNHFFPGTPVLSFGTAGCNLGCKFCQNWDISKSREVARLSAEAMPESIAAAALEHGCRSVAFTYNDPVIWAEYAIDTAAACRRLGIKAVAVTAGYITPQARGEFFSAMDAANIDLKAFTESFYFKTTGSHLQPVLDTIAYACNETDCWVELTNLIIPDANDDPDQLRRMCDWIVDTVGPEVPIHFSAFHPDFRMQDRPHTPAETLCLAYDLATQSGLRYVYTGNVHDIKRQSTYCPQCRQLLLARDWYQLGAYHLKRNRCGRCGYTIAGHFEDRPGDWGQKRQPIRIHPPEVHPMPSKPTVDLFQAELDDQQRQTIRIAASLVVQTAVRRGRSHDVADLLGELADQEVAGVYVTLKRGNTLRGCCGLQGPPIALHRAIADAAFRTATADPRMQPIEECELPYLTLSVSIIGPPEALDSADTAEVVAESIQIGRHGIRIRREQHVGLLLPSVAVDRNWNASQFLDAVCQKANLPPGVWRQGDCELYRFEGIYFGGRLLDSGGVPLEAWQSSQTDSDLDSRPPAVAGTFYPAEDAERERLVDTLLEDLPVADRQVVQAAMVPHAGLRYSGRIAADVWRRIQIPKNVLMIGPKHTRYGVDWAIAPHHQWQLSPSARVAGSVELARSLQAHLSGSKLDSAAHRHEHAFESQLPLLYRLAPETNLVCLAIGRSDRQQIAVAADELAGWLESLPEPPLLVISSDMNHFADEQETQRRDAMAIEPLQAGDPRALLDVCQREQISMCGRLPAALVLQTLRNLQRPAAGRLVAHGTSADITGDRTRVVGYAGMLFSSALAS